MYTICYWDSESGSQKDRPATPEEAAELDAQHAASGVPPDAVPMRSFRLALLAAGLLAGYQEAIDGTAGADGEMLRIDWATAPSVARTGRLASALVVMGKTSVEINSIFIAAGNIN